METQYDYRKFAILYVDDEEKSLKAFARAFGDDFRVFTAINAAEGARIIEEKKAEIAILMTDQKMPGEKGTWLLERARQIEPRIIRMLVTAYTDFQDAVEAINTGAIYRYVNKPWDPPQLEETLRHAMEFFLVTHERDQLYQEKMSVLRNLMVADRLVSLGLLAAGLSHHIRNALVAVKTFLDLAPMKMQEEKQDANTVRHPEFWGEYHRSVHLQIDKINNLLKELWMASEKPSLRFADEVNLHEVIAHTTESLKPTLAEKGIQIENTIASDLPALQVDKNKFCRLFELLLRDEIANLPPGSRVTFSAKLLDGPKPELEMLISDNGPGLPQDAADVLFDPFVVRADAPGEFGINLMACFFIAHHHGGHIEATSEKGKGTQFHLRFPLKPDRDLADLNKNLLQKTRTSDKLWENLASRS